MTAEIINFDMDGTIANLYGVEGWLNDLINEKGLLIYEKEKICNSSSRCSPSFYPNGYSHRSRGNGWQIPKAKRGFGH